MKTTYLTLITYTDQGIRNLKASPQRATAWKQEAESSGVKVLAQLWLTGKYDGALILEADSEAKIFSALTRLTAAGNVRSRSLRAFDVNEFAALMGG